MKVPATGYTHSQAHRDIEALADGYLSPERETQLQTHLAGCVACRAHQEEFLYLEKSLGELFQALPEVEYTSAENHAFTSQIKTSAKALQPLLQIPQWFHSLAWGATLALLMAGMAWVLANTRLEERPPIDPPPSLALSLNAPPAENYTFPGNGSPANQIAFSPDGKLLASAFDNGEVILWEVASQQAHLTLEADAQGVSSLTFATNGTLLFTLGKDNGTLKVWQPTNGQLLQTLTDIPGKPKFVGISPTGEIQFLRRPNELLLNASVTGQVPWATRRGQPTTPIVLPALAGEVVMTTVSPDGNILATGSSSGSIYFWQVTLVDGQRQGTPLRLFKDHSSPITALAFHPGGEWLVSASADGVVNVWRAGDGQLLYTLTEANRAVQSVAFSPDGSALATALDNGTVYLWVAEE